ncbi:hypothetical protein [Bradyrhizobium sp. 6(2017)]|uniref:hypothetical protein n=1 Tax=Bradyrhizobium sp. 6(2017) TaxID=1197460 RepID=UPI0013E20284|nr:hypothetical protein [Bradyrhizobium sp. 6(2017)]QIG96296.1 hypothetical protein G6P99_30440 [Bradyrhizobium sp. 6(2017)]
MIDGVELLTLRQRRSPNGDTYFTGRLGNAVIVMVRDDFERDVWKVIAGDPSLTRHNRPSPARAIAPPAHDDGDCDQGDASEEGAFDELPADLA